MFLFSDGYDGRDYSAKCIITHKKKSRAEQEVGGLILLIFRMQSGSKLVGLNLLFLPAVLKLVQKNSTQLNETLIILIVLDRSSVNITYLETRVDRQDVLHL